MKIETSTPQIGPKQILKTCKKIKNIIWTKRKKTQRTLDMCIGDFTGGPKSEARWKCALAYFRC